MEPKPQFGLAQAAYTAFRPYYPDALFERIVENVPADRRERAMDLGAGTGLSTLPLCRWFAEAIAVEPDAQMAAQLHGLHEGIVVRQCSAEECEQPASSVDLVTAGTAFYWMDGPRVMGKIASWLRPRGVLAVYRYGFPQMPAPVAALLDREMQQHWDAFRHDRLRDVGYSERVIRECRDLAPVDLAWLPYAVAVTPAQLAGFFSSTSYASAYMRTLQNPQEYLRTLEAELQSISRGGNIPLDMGIELILATKP